VRDIHPRRVFWLAFAAFFLMSAAWAVAMPVNGTYDEKHHIVRAYAVAHGDWFPAEPATERTGFGNEGFEVPASLLPGEVDCAWFPKPPKPASCQVPVTDRSPILVSSNVARYSPVYYLAVGLPLLAWPDATGILIGRLISVLLCALLLAAAASSAARLGRLVLAGVVLVATPMVINLAGSINPNGVEIAAGILVFTTLLALLRAGSEGPSGGGAGLDSGAGLGAGAGLDEPAIRRLLLLTGVAVAVLLTVRQLGPLLLAVDVAACAVLARPGRLRALCRLRAARWILGVPLLVGTVFFGYWTVASGIGDIKPMAWNARHGTAGELLHQIYAERVEFYLHQLVGQFGYGETTISDYAIDAWYALWALLVLPALLWAGWRVRLVLAGLAAFSAALLLGLELHFAPLVGWTQHGRYVLPAAVGMVLVAAAAASGGRSAAAAAREALAGQRWFAVGLAAATVPLHGYALTRVMTRYQIGIDAPLNPLHGSWLPPGGPLLPLALLALGLVALVTLVAVGPGSRSPEGWSAGPVTGSEASADRTTSGPDRTVDGAPDNDADLSTTNPATH